MTLALFWIAVSLLVYTYAAFPLLLAVRAKLMRRPFQAAEITPTVSLIVVAHNEEACLDAKLENIAALDYPRDRLEIVLASDGSTDGTGAIMNRWSDDRTKVLLLPRQGKIACLNQAVAAATGDVLVFSDANSMYRPDAIRQLVRPLADQEVGGVAGDQRYLKAGCGAAGECAYWNYDRQLKIFESAAGSVISATGAIYAIRRELFLPVPPSVTDDFVSSTAVIEQGRRLVFAPDAVAMEPPADRGSLEFGRKVRVITRGLRAIWVRRRLLNPLRSGFYAVQLFSHKLMRRMMVLPLLVILATTPLLWHEGMFYRSALAAQSIFYGCALVGTLTSVRPLRGSKVFAVPFYFCMVNLACLVALFNILRGRQINLWEPKRAAEHVPATNVLIADGSAIL